MNKILFASSFLFVIGCTPTPKIIPNIKMGSAISCAKASSVPERDQNCMIYTGHQKAIEDQVLDKLTAHGSGPYTLNLAEGEAAVCLNPAIIEHGKYKLCSIRYEFDFKQ